jgi:hypothetical protein
MWIRIAAGKRELPIMVNWHDGKIYFVLYNFIWFGAFEFNSSALGLGELIIKS